MNKFKLYFFLFCCTAVIFSCNQSDSADEVPIRDFDEQYADDMALIEDYLNTHSVKIEADDEVTIAKISETNTLPSIMSLYESESYPKLLKKSFEIDEKTYEIYYLKLREDNSNTSSVSPSRADGVLTSYRGSYLSYETEVINEGEENEETITTLNTTLFEYTPNPVDYFFLDTTIRGWREILPLFKTGNSITNEGQPTSYTDFGYGVIFIPSGFGYFNRGQSSSSGVTIPSYSPLMFTFKLLDVKLGDQDADGIKSNDEDLNHDGDFTNDDTDGDDIQNLYDTDDDGDGFYTRYEVIINEDGSVTYIDRNENGVPDYLEADQHP